MATVKPTVNQIRLHPSNYHEMIPVIEFMHEQGIAIEGYSPIRVLRDGSAPGVVKVVEAIAEEKKAQPEQVLLAWSKAKGFVPITSSATKSRIVGYIAAGDIDLTTEP